MERRWRGDGEEMERRWRDGDWGVEGAKAFVSKLGFMGLNPATHTSATSPTLYPHRSRCLRGLLVRHLAFDPTPAASFGRPAPVPLLVLFSLVFVARVGAGTLPPSCPMSDHLRLFFAAG